MESGRIICCWRNKIIVCAVPFVVLSTIPTESDWAVREPCSLYALHITSLSGSAILYPRCLRLRASAAIHTMSSVFSLRVDAYDLRRLGRRIKMQCRHYPSRESPPAFGGDSQKKGNELSWQVVAILSHALRKRQAGKHA